MTDKAFYPLQSPVSTGLAGRCPRCGQGALFAGYIETAPSCSICGLDYDFIDSGDGPAVFVMFIVGFVVVGSALVVELAIRPAIWVHMMLWIPLTLVLALGLLRPLKGIMIALQFRNKAEEGRLSE